MNRRKSLALFAVLIAALSACTKGKTPVNDPNMISAQKPDPNLLIMEATVSVPTKLRNKVSKFDSIVWSVSDSKGKRVAHGLTKVEKLPRKISVLAKQLITPIEKDSNLQMNVQVAKPGNEFKQVDQNWLVASSIGHLKGTAAKEPKKLAVGSKIQLELEQF